MDDTLNLGIFLEYVLEGFEVAAVNLLESGADAGDLLDTVDNIGVRVGQIVDNYYFVACLLQLYGCVASNKTCTTSH